MARKADTKIRTPFAETTLNKQALTEKLLYTLVWSCVLLVPVLNAVMFRREPFDWNTMQVAWGTVMPYLLIFFLHNSWIAPRLLIRGHYLWYALATIAAVTTVFFAVYLYQNWIGIDPNDDINELRGRVSLTNLSFSLNVTLGVFLCGLNASIKMIFKSLRDEQIMESLKRTTLQSELDYLRYQINPHFFMNTLNNIHALIDLDTEAAKDTVIELSKMMRYVLYDSERERVEARQEIRFLHHYIRLMRLRYSGSVDIRVHAPDDLPAEVCIPPLVLIVFVENAFKHGVSYNRPSFIHIEAREERGGLFFRVHNARHTREWSRQGGIGLDNVRKRLDLIYGPAYRLTIREGEDDYLVELNLPTL